MKILQLVTRDQHRGAEEFAAKLSGELASRGHDLTFAALFAGPPVLELDERVARVNLNGSPRFGFSPGLVFDLRCLIRLVRPDVIQANGSDTLKYAVAARMLSGVGVALVYRNISMISYWASGPVRKRSVCVLLRHVDRVASVSEASRLDLLGTCKLQPGKVMCIARGVPVPSVVDRAAARRQLEALVPGAADSPLLFHVGSHTAEKNHAQLLEIFSRVRAQVPEARLLSFGAGPLTPSIEARIARDGLDECVHLLGVRADAAELLPAAGLLLLPSHIEGIPGAILEAAAVGVPAVAYDVGGVREVVADGLTGIAVPHGHAENFSRAVVALLRDEGSREEMGRRAREYVLAHHSLTLAGGHFETLYMDLLKERRRG